MLFPLLGEQMSDADFRYLDLIWGEFVAKWPIWMQKVGGNKSQLPLRRYRNYSNVATVITATSLG